MTNKKFIPFAKLLKNRDHALKEATAEEIELEMKRDLKDKLIPYHNMPYTDQIKNKENFLKEVFQKFVTRVSKEVILQKDILHPVFYQINTTF